MFPHSQVVELIRLNQELDASVHEAHAANAAVAAVAQVLIIIVIALLPAATFKARWMRGVLG